MMTIQEALYSKAQRQLGAQNTPKNNTKETLEKIFRETGMTKEELLEKLNKG